MKVLIISHMYPSIFNEVAGIFVHEQVKALVDQGCEVKVISPVPWAPFLIQRLSPKWMRYSEIPLRATCDGIEVYYPRCLTFPRMLFFASSGQWMYRGISNLVGEIYQDFAFDLIHAHTTLPDGFAAMLLKRDYDKPLVITIHGRDLHTTLYRSAQCKQAIVKAFKQTERIITVSTKLKRIAEEEIGCSDKMVVINNGINPRKICSAARPRIPLLGARTILSVSNLIATKGIDLNLKAISQLIAKHHELKHIVIGDGPQMDNLRRLASTLNLNNHVEFLGRLPHEDVMVHMASADIFSLPSWREGLGVVYLEAMAHGKPIIACLGEGIEDVVTNGETGLLVERKSVDSLVKALDFLLSHPEKAQAMGERARKLVLAEYTWEKNAEKTLEVYQRLLK